MAPLLVLLACAALIGGAGYWTAQQEKKRALAFRGVAQGLGWALDPHPPLTVLPGPSRFELFTAGWRQQIRNHAAGHRGDRRVAVFDYTYATGTGRSQAVWRQTVVHVHSPRLELPAFVLRPEHVHHKVGALFGYQDIDVADDPVFSERYLLRGADEAAIRARFGEEVRDFYDLHPKSCTEASGADLFFWRTGRFARPEEVPGLVEAALDLADRFERGAAVSPSA
jgi:hypothetical protein